MIDLLKAKKYFKEYTSNFEVKDNKVNVKIKHTYGVVDAAKYIATELNLSEKDIELAQLIALLHDIGRFEQAVRYDNFDDFKEMDHADYGVKLLFKQNLIRKFIETDEYDEIIEKAVKNHNKFEIEEGLNDRELLHAKIIRDADKTDNFNIKRYQDFFSLYKSTENDVEKEKISDDVWKDFLCEKSIISSHRKTNMDHWISYLAWIYDYNFKPGLKYLIENNCIDALIDRLDYKDKETKERMEKARKLTKEYINKRIND